MLSLVLSQPCAKLLVGDPHQQIYAFRRAVDALSSVPSTHTFCLTQVACLLSPFPRACGALQHSPLRSKNAASYAPCAVSHYVPLRGTAWIIQRKPSGQHL